MNTILPDLEIHDLSESRKLSLKEYCQGKAGIIDFWHTKCTRCPAALEKLNLESGKNKRDDILYAACAISQGDGNLSLVEDVSSE